VPRGRGALNPLLRDGVHHRLRRRALRAKVDEAGKQDTRVEEDAQRLWPAIPFFFDERRDVDRRAVVGRHGGAGHKPASHLHELGSRGDPFETDPEFVVRHLEFRAR